MATFFGVLLVLFSLFVMLVISYNSTEKGRAEWKQRAAVEMRKSGDPEVALADDGLIEWAMGVSKKVGYVSCLLSLVAGLWLIFG